MTGDLPPLASSNESRCRHNAVLYVDDAHGTGVLGQQGRGTVLDALGNYDNTLVVGSLSKAFSCFGGFIGCPRDIQDAAEDALEHLHLRRAGAAPYLDAICTVCDILDFRRVRLNSKAGWQSNLARLTRGAQQLGPGRAGRRDADHLHPGRRRGGHAERAAHFLFETGFYVQSVTFPAVPYHAGVLRIQVNANHLSESHRRLARGPGRVETAHFPAGKSRRAA